MTVEDEKRSPPQPGGEAGSSVLRPAWWSTGPRTETQIIDAILA
jgi:hypothetical protein